MKCASCDPSAAESQKVANHCTFKCVAILNTKNCHICAILNLGCLFPGRGTLMLILTGKVIISISGIRSIRYLKQSFFQRKTLFNKCRYPSSVTSSPWFVCSDRCSRINVKPLEQPAFSFAQQEIILVTRGNFSKWKCHLVARTVTFLWEKKTPASLMSAQQTC